jgi:PleD family two-component response regulator
MKRNGFPRPPIVLIASAHEWSVRSLESVLSASGFAIIRAFTAEQAIQRIEGGRPDAVIIEHPLPERSGAELCRQLRTERLISVTTPVMLVQSGIARHDHLRAALEAGAWDCFELPLPADVLVLKLTAYVAAKLEADAAHEESLLDRESGFYNMRGLLQRLKEVGHDAARHNLPVACVAFSAEPIAVDGDIARLRQLGSAEDGLTAQLDRLATRLRSIFRGSDIVGRVAHNEFAVVAPHTDPSGARRLAERIAECGEATAELPVRIQLRTGCFAVEDFGQARIEPLDLLVRATMALRHAPDSETDRVRFYTEAPRAAGAAPVAPEMM